MRKTIVGLLLSVTLVFVLGLGAGVAQFSPDNDDSALEESVGAQPPTTYLAYMPNVLKSWPAVCSTAPTLVSPSDGAVLNTLVPAFTAQYASGMPQGAIFGMEASAGISFEWLDFAALTSRSWTGGPWTSSPLSNLSPGTLYYWRAWVQCAGGERVYSAPWTFTTGSGGTLPDQVQLLAPANGAGNVATPVQYSWAPATQADAYRIFVVSHGQNSHNYTAGPITATSATWPVIWFSLDPGQNCEWRVKGMNEYGYGPNSATWTFTTALSTSLDYGPRAISEAERETTECLSAYTEDGSVLYCGGDVPSRE